VHPNLLRRNLIYLGFRTRSEKQKLNAFEYHAEQENEKLEALALGIWLGERTKSGKRVEVTNCNPLILRVWLSFLLKICSVNAAKLKLRISLHNPLLKKRLGIIGLRILVWKLYVVSRCRKLFLIVCRNSQWEQLLSVTIV